MMMSDSKTTQNLHSTVAILLRLRASAYFWAKQAREVPDATCLSPAFIAWDIFRHHLGSHISSTTFPFLAVSLGVAEIFVT